MTPTLQPPDKSQQISVWLRGLLTIAWADKHFDPEEQALIATLTHQELTTIDKTIPLEPISLEELIIALGNDPHMAEDFLRTAVMVAVVDGVYSQTEAEYLSQYCEALGLKREALDVLYQTVAEPSETPMEGATIHTARFDPAQLEAHHDVLQPVRDWLDQLSIHDPRLARFLCNLIPAQCPFERDINLFGRKIAHIPPLCKLNPLYEQLVTLRFRALCYLADTCGEDVSPYC